ncbi:hypothetical protein [Streptomyces sp. NPDC091209]
MPGSAGGSLSADRSALPSGAVRAVALVTRVYRIGDYAKTATQHGG